MQRCFGADECKPCKPSSGDTHRMQAKTMQLFMLAADISEIWRI